MKKLLIVSDSFLPRWDGIARFLSDIIPSLSKEYDITVLAPRFKGTLPEYKNVKIIRFPLLKLIKLGDTYPCIPSIRKIKDSIKEADIVWTHTLGTIGLAAIKYAKKYNKPVIASVHSLEGELIRKAIRNIFKKSLFYFLYKTIGISSYNKCNLLLIPSKEVGKELNELKVKTKKLVLHLGVNTNKFIPSDDKAASKLKINLKAHTKVIGFCGRIGREKDLMTLYKAFQRLKNHYPNIVLLIVGEGLKEQKKIFKKDEKVIVTGSKNDVVPYLQAMDVYVLPSLTETSSLSTMEAMSCSIPVITTKIGYPKKYIREKVNGLFFPIKNDYVLNIKLDSLLKDDNVRKDMGREARNTIKERFSLDKTIKEIKRVLMEF